jgi:hypothetical protein
MNVLYEGLVCLFVFSVSFILTQARLLSSHTSKQSKAQTSFSTLLEIPFRSLIRHQSSYLYIRTQFFSNHKIRKAKQISHATADVTGLGIDRVGRLCCAIDACSRSRAPLFRHRLAPGSE